MNIQLPPGAVLIGQGKQGSVYKLSAERCMKWYSNEAHAQMEYEAYLRAEDSSIIPKLYGHGPNYIVIEYIAGEPLRKGLARRGTITRSESEQILFIIYEMMRVGFTRMDAALFHIYIRENQPSKIIDLVHSYKSKHDIPKVMLKGLAKMRLLAPFMQHVKELDPEMYRKWMNHIETRSDRYGDLRAFNL